MAANQLQGIAREAGAKWSGARIAIEHRLGTVPLGEASVVIAVGTPHRAEAFECCRFLIEELKHRVPIWKKEIGVSVARWVEGSSASDELDE
jgi:molybdopterin synthase catalytic subunit